MNILYESHKDKCKSIPNGPNNAYMRTECTIDETTLLGKASTKFYEETDCNKENNELEVAQTWFSDVAQLIELDPSKC